MKQSTRTVEERGGIALTGDAVHLLCTAPLATLATYMAGSVPFVLGLLYYWSDMSRSAFAAERCFEASLAVAGLFLWMKIWHAIFAAGLDAHLRGAPPPRWPARRLLRLAIVQLALQPYGLLAIPFSLLLLMPFPLVHAFYQNLTVLGDGTRDTKSTVSLAWRQAARWPRQNALAIWLLSPWPLGAGLLFAFGTTWLSLRMQPSLSGFNTLAWVIFGVAIVSIAFLPFSPLGCVTACNAAALVLFVPWAMKTFLGINTRFMLGPGAILNSTFLMVVFGLSFLVLDPFTKAVYVLRCFLGSARATGDDLRVELRTLAAARAQEENA